MNKVFILGACRTPIGKMGGSLAALSAVELGGIVIKEALKRSGVPTDAVDHVYMGCVIQAGLGQNVARQAALKAGLGNSTTAQTVNIVCGSGLDSVNSAARMIACGDADVVIAGGTEGDICMAEPFGSAMMELRAFMFDKVYTSHKAKSEDSKVTLLIEYLFGYYKKNPSALPAENYRMIERDGLDRCICDHIASMTDRYAISTFEEIYVPRVWSM